MTGPEATFTWDVVVVGAGMAGLSCARRLAEAGLRVCVLEARDRVGGRVRTERVHGTVVEMGAEFVHGRPPELLRLIEEAGLTIVEREGTMLLARRGEIVKDDESAERFSPLEELKGWSRPDMSFAAWLEEHAGAIGEEERAAATGYVEGFNAADAQEISVVALGVQQAAEEEIGGAGAAHVAEGYDRVPEWLAERVRALGGEVRCGVDVRAVHWGVGRVAIETSAGEFVAERAVITLPLGVLQARSVRMVPEPEAVLRSAEQMRMGSVARWTALFRDRWWERREETEAMNFLFDEEAASGKEARVWWAQRPEPAATLTGWTGGPESSALGRMSGEELTEVTTRSLARIFGTDEPWVREQMLACRTYDWSADQWSRGAYSYVGVGGTGASLAMSQPVEHTLFFAGEHTDTTGHWGTVHGAMRSGERAARQMLAGREQGPK